MKYLIYISEKTTFSEELCTRISIVLSELKADFYINDDSDPNTIRKLIGKKNSKWIDAKLQTEDELIKNETYVLFGLEFSIDQPHTYPPTNFNGRLFWWMEPQVEGFRDRLNVCFNNHVEGLLCPFFPDENWLQSELNEKRSWFCKRWIFWALSKREIGKINVSKAKIRLVYNKIEGRLLNSLFLIDKIQALPRNEFQIDHLRDYSTPSVLQLLDEHQVTYFLSPFLSPFLSLVFQPFVSVPPFHRSIKLANLVALFSKQNQEKDSFQSSILALRQKKVYFEDLRNFLHNKKTDGVLKKLRFLFTFDHPLTLYGHQRVLGVSNDLDFQHYLRFIGAPNALELTNLSFKELLLDSFGTCLLNTDIMNPSLPVMIVYLQNHLSEWLKHCLKLSENDSENAGKLLRLLQVTFSCDRSDVDQYITFALDRITDVSIKARCRQLYRCWGGKWKDQDISNIKQYSIQHLYVLAVMARLQHRFDIAHLYYRSIREKGYTNLLFDESLMLSFRERNSSGLDLLKSYYEKNPSSQGIASMVVTRELWTYASNFFEPTNKTIYQKILKDYLQFDIDMSREKPWCHYLMAVLFGEMDREVILFINEDMSLAILKAVGDVLWDRCKVKDSDIQKLFVEAQSSEDRYLLLLVCLYLEKWDFSAQLTKTLSNISLQDLGEFNYFFPKLLKCKICQKFGLIRLNQKFELDIQAQGVSTHYFLKFTRNENEIIPLSGEQKNMVTQSL